MFVNIKVMKILIREAQKKDMNSVHKLIVELAIYEKEPDAVEIDVKELTNMGFSSAPPLFKRLIAEVNNTIVGAANIYNRFSTWKGKTLHLEDLIITETMRNNGIGSKLFDEVIRYGKKIGAQRISWNVIDWNQSAIKFYESKGAEIVKGWSIVHLSGNNLKNYS